MVTDESLSLGALQNDFCFSLDYICPVALKAVVTAVGPVWMCAVEQQTAPQNNWLSCRELDEEIDAAVR